MIEKEKEALNLLSFPTFPDGLTTVAVPNTSNGLVVLAYPKDLDEFFAASLVKEDASSIPTPTPQNSFFT